MRVNVAELNNKHDEWKRNLPTNLYCAADVRELDRIAIEEFAVSGETLMKRAGKAAFTQMLINFPHPDLVRVYCGAGNNGGDGFVIAKLARERGLNVEIIQLGDSSNITGDALTVRNEAIAAQVKITPFSTSGSNPSGVLTVVVDAMLGTGLEGAVRAEYQAAINKINRGDQRVLAVDIPSGLCSDSGRELDEAVDADITVTFIGMKRGLLTGAGPAVCGEVIFDSLDVPDEVYNQVSADCLRVDTACAPSILPARRRDAHKGNHGHVLIVGGDFGMGGAVSMAAEAAARVGAGLVSVATRAQHVAGINARCPEIMVHGVTSGHELAPLLDAPTVIVVGPGLGRSAWSEQLLQQVLKTNLPLIVDADALTLVSRQCGQLGYRRDEWILTPHPGEMKRLLGVANKAIEDDRFAAVTKLQELYGGTVILKGAGSLIASAGEPIALANVGNPGMATAGMGDVLSGTIAGIVAQVVNGHTLPKNNLLHSAACLGVAIHGEAADRVVCRTGERGLQATDIIPAIREMVNVV